jgi:peptidyl-prolyl cis-trans isomerase C
MRASHILIEHFSPYPPSQAKIRRTKEEALALAQELASRIADGESFADLAMQYPACPSKEDGGDLGRFGKGQMTPSFEIAVQELEIFQLSEPVHTPYGYHVILRTE